MARFLAFEGGEAVARVRAQPARTVARALEAFCARFARQVADGVRAAGTLTMHQGHGRWLVEVLGAELPLERIDETFLEELVEHARARGGRDGEPLSAKTVQKRLTTLHGALVLAHRGGGIPRVPVFPAFCFAAARAQPSVFRSGADFWRLFHALPRRRAEWMAVAFLTAQHAADVERMIWAELELEASPPTMLIRNTKNRRPAFRVKMPAPLVDILLERRARLTAAGRAPVLIDRVVDPWPSRAIQLARASIRIGLPPMNANKLRHAATSAMVRRRGITVAAQKWGGWQSTRMMEVVYAHALPAQLEEASDEIASFVDENV